MSGFSLKITNEPDIARLCELIYCENYAYNIFSKSPTTSQYNKNPVIVFELIQHVFFYGIDYYTEHHSNTLDLITRISNKLKNINVELIVEIDMNSTNENNYSNSEPFIHTHINETNLEGCYMVFDFGDNDKYRISFKQWN